MISKNHRFSSERLSYRGITEADAPLIVGWRNDPRNYRWFHVQAPITIEGHISWFESYLDDRTRFDFMVLDPVGRPIGTAGLSNISDATCEVNYMIGEETARGMGYATEAVQAMCSLAFRELRVASVKASILSGNEASIRTAMAAGMTERERIFAIERKEQGGHFSS